MHQYFELRTLQQTNKPWLVLHTCVKKESKIALQKQKHKIVKKKKGKKMGESGNKRDIIKVVGELVTVVSI